MMTLDTVTRSLQAIAVRLLLMGLLFVGYWTAWRPARAIILNEAAVPVLQWSADHEEQVRPTAGPVRLELPSGADRSMPAPAGVTFLLPALFLVAVFPDRPYWLIFWAGHCLLFVFIMLAWAAALMHTPGAEPIAGFLQTYGVDIYSMGLPIIWWAAHRRRVARAS